MDKELTDWYGEINEEDVLPNGVIKLKVPVLDAGDGRPHGFPPIHHPSVDDCGDTEDENPPEPTDPVVMKDKATSMKAFIIAKRIQNILIRAASLAEPYEEDSEKRQELTDALKTLHRELGEQIVKL